jgi:hypothetical protein
MRRGNRLTQEPSGVPVNILESVARSLLEGKGISADLIVEAKSQEQGRREKGEKRIEKAGKKKDNVDG